MLPASVVVVAAVLLSSCQGLSPVATVREPETNGEVELIRFGNIIRTYSDQMLESHYRRSVSAQAADPSPDNTIRLALLLSYPGAPFYDVTRARRLLGDALADADGSRGSLELARLIDSFLFERNSVTGDAAMLADLFTQERERNYELGLELAEARAALEAERELRVTLQGQLDALKELEERLNADDRP